MAEIGFQVTLNGAPLAKAGIDSAAQITTLILGSLHRKDEDAEPPYLTLSGMDIAGRTRHRWVEDMTLAVGDRLTVTLVHGPFDPPTASEADESEAVVLAQKLAYFHRLKAELEEKGML